MPLEPGGAEFVADKIGLPEYVAPTPREAGRIEDGFKFCKQRTGCVVERAIGLIPFPIQVVRHERLGCGRPARSRSGVILEHAPAGPELKISRPLGHGRFDDLISHHQKQVSPPAPATSAPTLPVRSPSGSPPVPPTPPPPP